MGKKKLKNILLSSHHKFKYSLKLWFICLVRVKTILRCYKKKLN